MFSLQGTPGHTTLSLVTFRNPHSPTLSRHVRVNRSTTRRCWNGGKETSETLYTFPLSELESEVDSGVAVDTFIKLAMQLINRENDLAIRHVSAMLVACDREEITALHHWIPPRKLDFAESLDAVITPVKLVDLAAEDVSCNICQCPFDDPNSPGGEKSHQPVRLLSCGHIFGLSCIQIWIEHTLDVHDVPIQPGRCTCPLDRGTLFPPCMMRSLQFGLDKGVYYHDSRYSDFENFERSIADLDSYPPADLDKQAMIRINATVLTRGWDNFLQGALLEPESSTPFPMQPVRFPEMEMATTAIDVHL